METDINLKPIWISGLNIRLLTANDLPALEWEGEYAHYRRMYRDIYQDYCQGRALMWLAELPETGLIGQAFIQLDSDVPELADGFARAYLYGFRVKPPYRSAGVGGKMLQYLEKDLRQRNFLVLTLNVGKDNPRARQFYEAHGYRVIGVEAGDWSYLDDQGQRRIVHEPAWRMEKSLGK